MTLATRTNEDIKRDIVDQLYWDGRVDAAEVKIQVEDGKVVLTGTVPNYTAYDAASDDAWSIAGVLFVQNDLTIKYPPHLAVPTDADIEANIENLLIWQPAIDSTEIEVAAQNGWVTLRGTVDAFWKKVRAEMLALDQKGVLGISNELAVVPTRDIEDRAIAEDLEAAFERNVTLDEDCIDIRVENGQVTVSGSVPSLPAFRAAQEIVQNTFGVLSVNNELVIR